MKILVGGSRDFDDYLLLKRVLNQMTAKASFVTIITGACPSGADALAEQWASENFYTVVRFHAEWDKHGKAAGPIRNSEMVKECGARRAVFFHDGESPGTKDCIRKAKAAGMKVKIVNYGEKE